MILILIRVRFLKGQIYQRKGTIKMTVARISMVKYVSKEVADDSEP